MSVWNLQFPCSARRHDHWKKGRLLKLTLHCLGYVDWMAIHQQNYLHPVQRGQSFCQCPYDVLEQLTIVPRAILPDGTSRNKRSARCKAQTLSLPPDVQRLPVSTSYLSVEMRCDCQLGNKEADFARNRHPQRSLQASGTCAVSVWADVAVCPTSCPRKHCL